MWGTTHRSDLLQVCAPLCAMCETGLTAGHPHLVRVAQGYLMCLCQKCYGAVTRAEGRFDQQPGADRIVSIAPFEWPLKVAGDIELANGITLLVRSSLRDRLVACWSAPHEVVEVALPPGLWPRLVAANPAVSILRVDVETLLLRHVPGATGADECLLVPTRLCEDVFGSLRIGQGAGHEHDRLTAALDDLWTQAAAQTRANGVAHHADEASRELRADS